MQIPILTTQTALDEPGAGNHSPARRLIVLVPPDKFDTQALSIIVQTMAKSSPSVLWLALANDPESDIIMRRCLKSLAATIHGPQVKSGYQLAFFDNWLEAVQSVWINGDRIICLAGHMTRNRWLSQQPVAQLLAAHKMFSVEVIQGLELQKPGLVSGFWRGLSEWVLATGIILLFFFIQVYISRNTPDILGKILVILSILVEFWLIARFGTG